MPVPGRIYLRAERCLERRAPASVRYTFLGARHALRASRAERTPPDMPAEPLTLQVNTPVALARLYRSPALGLAEIERLRVGVAQRGLGMLVVPQTEWCFYVECSAPLDSRQEAALRWLLTETFEPEQTRPDSFLPATGTCVEIGPRLSVETAWSSTAVGICQACGIEHVTRLERSLRLGFAEPLPPVQEQAVRDVLCDRMTQMRYPAPLVRFTVDIAPEPTRRIPLLVEGKAALERINRDLGLAMDEQDLDRFYALFAEQLRRDPTDVELFQLAQANSEHCRHGFFKGQPIIDGRPMLKSLMQLVKEPWKINPGNSLIAFADDSSAIRGGPVQSLVPENPLAPSAMVPAPAVLHPTLTAETHNFPSGIAPFPGAATGTGGRIRDNQCVGRGGHVVASGAAYCTGNLHIPGYDLPWEDDGHAHPTSLASPLSILIEASNGASSYGNCYGEPVILGFARTAGIGTPGGYRAWFKPIMYTEGVGAIDDRHVKKGEPETGMVVVQVGGPAYRIGMGGGAASSLMGGQNDAELDFNAVQRGDPEMEQRMNRVIRACIELGERNPIVSAHDLGAGGDANALPEIVYPAGARIDLRALPVGDQSLSVLELWGNESQERNAVLVRENRMPEFLHICERENAPVAAVGLITGDCRLVLTSGGGDDPVDLPLEPVLGDVPPKPVSMERLQAELVPLALPRDLTVAEALERVLRLPAVASKSYLTRKVDRCVTGLVAQQQCVGPNHLPLADFAVAAHSYLGLTGTALSLGEQPLKGLVSPQAMARVAVAESLLNLAGARITRLQDIKCQANWMWAAKLPGEGARLYDAAGAMRDIMVALGIAVDGGKDSLSMAVTGPSGEMIMAPGQLVIAAYAPMDDVRRKATPDLKREGDSFILIDLAPGKARLGGSALAQVYQQVGDTAPDVDDVNLLQRVFEAVQALVGHGMVNAVHDRSDGGLIVTLLEMAFGGSRGIDVALFGATAIESLFNEELGLVLATSDPDAALAHLHGAGVPAAVIGRVTGLGDPVVIRWNGEIVLSRPVAELRAIWDETSTRLEELQAAPALVREEARVMNAQVTSPPYRLTYVPTPTDAAWMTGPDKPKAAVLREEGSNGDREMLASLYAAGFEAWDVTMSDLLADRARLDDFRGVVFPGGFAFGDVLDSGKGWAGVIRFHTAIAEQFAAFYARPDTFSLGVCNGCQLMALLGWVPWPSLPDVEQPRFIRNASGRFECRWTTVEITESPAVMFKGMSGSRLGAWVAHGEGQLHAPQIERIIDAGLAPLRFVDGAGRATTTYPLNPNGSAHGVTGLCSPDGRHLAIMPHPERSATALWQWPWLPDDWRDLPVSPWLRMFQNARAWCTEGK